MARRDIGVAIGIPEPCTSELQGWRERLGDPNAADIPPHVTLLPPTTLTTDDLHAVEEHLREAAAGVEPFVMHLRGSGTFRPVSPVVFVTLAQGVASRATVRCAPDAPGQYSYLFGNDRNAGPVRLRIELRLAGEGRVEAVKP